MSTSDSVIVYVHGIGEHQPGYSDAWNASLTPHLGEYVAKQPTKAFVSDESCRYLGRQYQLNILRQSTVPSIPQATIFRGRFVVPVARRWGVERRRSAVQAALATWYRGHADVQIRSTVDRFSARCRLTLILADFPKLVMRVSLGLSGRSCRNVKSGGRSRWAFGLSSKSL